MSKVVTSNLTEGLIVAENVYSKAGQLIIPANCCLTQQMILHLSYYGINEVTINEGDIPLEAQKAMIIKKQIQDNFKEKIESTPEYAKFHDDYLHDINVIEKHFNDIILKNTQIDEPNLITETVNLFNEYESTYSLFGMLHSMQKIDDSTYAHCINVSIICRLIGTWLNLSDEDLDHLTMAGLLHDIGKCKVPEDIILKPGKLSPQEYEMVKMHTSFGYAILQNQDIDERIKKAALLHHERFDGSGYPMGIANDEIDLFSAIVSIADVYDAMTSNRVYRGALCPFDVIASFEKEGLNKYHPGTILVFLEKIANSYVNSEVLLSDGNHARIILINNRKLTRPIVQIGDNFINLEERPDLYIEAII